MSKKQSLKDLIERIDWVALNSSVLGSRLREDEMAVSYYATKKGSPYASYIQIRMGHKLVANMGWEIQDKISAMYDPDDVMSFILCKTESSSGRVLSKEKNTHVHKINFKWPNEINIKLKPLHSRVVSYDIYKQYIHLILPTE
jgi:hypothetical protein